MPQDSSLLKSWCTWLQKMFLGEFRASQFREFLSFNKRESSKEQIFTCPRERRKGTAQPHLYYPEHYLTWAFIERNSWFKF